ncbi:MAG: hypothetical protein CVU85_01575 [Firmicutes bacterium HGW-Firmicutes-10]|jgi:hypothetical protein|nr:MAG: hypothetical protein CVU85_01575 [Firmicutes bacterium HGW-Firmicutes-10]
MNVKEQFAERVEIFNDAVRMKKAPKRVPFASNDAFWRYHDLGYKLSEALLDPQSIENAVIDFQKRYDFDLLLDIGDRNPLIMTRSLGNFEYQIDDKNNTLMLEEQCHLKAEDYDKFIKNPVKTLWEEILPRKYSYFKPGMDLPVLQNTLGKFLEYDQSIKKTTQRLIDECGVPEILNTQENGAKIFPAFECLYNFLRGMKGLSGDMRRTPDKVLEFTEVYHQAFIKPIVDNFKKIDEPSTCFTAFTIMLSQNMINRKQFEKFFWPHFKQLADKIVETDGTMFILSEGTTSHITDLLQELPKGHFCFYVESDDIFERRKQLPNLCFWGGLPLSLLSRGTKQECIDHAKRVIDEVGTVGGLILSPEKFTSNPRDCNRENLLAVSEFVRNYK